MSTSPANAARLIELGLSQNEAEALERAWSIDLIHHLLGDVAQAIHEGGGTAAEAVDFAMHKLDESSASMYRSNGFTAHQAHLIESEPQAHNNLFDRNTLSTADFLDADAPREFIVQVLRVAHSPGEADRFLNRYLRAAAGRPVLIDGAADTAQGVLDEVAVIAQHLSTIDCDCDFD